MDIFWATVPVIPFHDHMILFSDSPLISLPSFLHDSLTMWFCIFPFLLYLVMFISCPSDVVPHLSATSEVSYFIYMILHPISYWLCTCSYHIYRWIYLDIVPHLSATSELSYLQILPCSFCVSITAFTKIVILEIISSLCKSISITRRINTWNKIK